MSMVVRTNILAMNAQRQLNLNNNALSKSLAKLASGYRINSAADDAAGLAISEAMKAQIKGLEAASTNSQDGISLVQTAEGALTEVHDMLNRMSYLATRAANGIYTDSQRQQYAAEINQLTEEIDRISDSTTFNSIKLLDGSMSANVEASIRGNGITNEGMSTATQNITETGSIADVKLKEGGQLRSVFEYTDSDGSQKAFSVDLTLEGYAKGDDTHYRLVSSEGAQYDLGKLTATGGEVTIAATSVTRALYLELNTRSEFTSKFTVSGTDGSASATASGKAAAIGTDAKGLKITTIDAGSKGADITGISITSRLDSKIETDWNYGGLAGEDVYHDDGLDSYQKLDFSALQVVTSKEGAGGNEKGVDDKSTVAAKVFEVNGFKFALANGTAGQNAAGDTVTAQESMAANARVIKEAGFDDVYIIGVTGTSFDATADGQHLVDEINKVAGTNLKFTKTALAQDKASEIKANSIFNGNAGEMLGVNQQAKGDALTLQIGDTNDSYNKLKIDIKDMHSKALGLDKIDISTPDKAANSMQIIRDAIDKVSAQRATLGATQNRLEHTINNLDTMVENVTNANSRIRDTDMAAEMTNYTKLNVLVQSAQSMLAQANQSTQSVLSLLR